MRSLVLAVLSMLLLPATLLAHGNWPQTVVGEPNIWIGMVSPVAADLDNDGTNELVLTTQGNSEGHLSTLYIFEANGDVRAKVNADYYFDPRTFPSIADIDGDGSMEIVLECGSLLIYDSHGVLEHVYDTPFQMSDNLFASTVLADVNNDNATEIIYGGWYLDGSRLVVLDTNGNDVPGFPVMLEHFGSSETNTPAVGNLDDDAQWEIVTISHRNGAPADTTNIRAYNADGSLLWSQRIFAISYSDPVIGDVNGDGLNEVAFTSLDGVYVLDRNGDFILNLPLGAGMEHSNIALADFDYDDDLEIVFGYGYTLRAFHHDGTPIFSYEADWLPLNPPVIGDINYDGSPDILFNTDDEIYAMNVAGLVLNGFPKPMQPIAYSSPSIDDIDGDGKVDVMSSSNWIEPDVAVGIIYVWELHGSYYQAGMQWQMFQHDPQHTGYFQSRPAADVNDEHQAGTPSMLLSAVPNPSAGPVRMTYGLRGATAVTIEVFNAAGSLVRRLEGGTRAAGKHAIDWDGRDSGGKELASGVYLTRMVTDEGVRTGRVVIAR